MKKLLLSMGLSFAVLPIHADELVPTTKEGATDLPPPRVRPAPPQAVTPAPAEPAPVVVAPEPKPVAEPPPVATPAPVVKPVAPAMTPTKVAPVAVAPMARPDDTGWFAGLGLGYSINQDYVCTDCGDPLTSLDDDGFAYKIFGGYRLHRNFALSAGYLELADTDAASVGGGTPWTDKLKVDGLYAAAHGILPVTDKIDVFATLGFLRWDQKVNFDGLSGSFDGTDLMYGVGASYNIAKPGVKVQLEWNRFPDVGTNDPLLGHKDDYDLFTVNLVYQF